MALEPAVIRLKRRLATGDAGPPGSLLNAEPAFSEKDNILYYGNGVDVDGKTATSIVAIGGAGAFVSLLDIKQTILGEKTFDESPLIPTADFGDESFKAASTEFVATAIGLAAPSFRCYRGEVDPTESTPTAAGVIGTPAKGDIYKTSKAGSVAFKDADNVAIDLQLGEFIMFDGTAWTKVAGLNDTNVFTSAKLWKIGTSGVLVEAQNGVDYYAPGSTIDCGGF